MLDFIKNFLLQNNIDLAGALKLSECHLTRPYKLKGFKEDEYSSLSVIIFAIPYLANYERIFPSFCDTVKLYFSKSFLKN